MAFRDYPRGNLLGQLLLGRLFDTVGRKPMIAGTYLVAAAGAALLAVLVGAGNLSEIGFLAIICALFFVASAGASSAYLTVSEIFPMETRALAIAFFFAVGTGIGGIVGPLLFGRLIESGETGQLALGFGIGAAVMAVGGLAALFFAVKAEGRSLEDIAKPLTVEEEAEGERDVEDERDPERRTRISRREQNRIEREQRGPRRFAPGRGPVARDDPERFELTLDEEIGLIARALREQGVMDREQLSAAVGAAGWGPGRFAEALRAAEREGQIERLSPNRFAAPVPRYPA